MACKGCPYQGKRIIKASGNKSAHLMICGEAPAEKEIRTGLPFQGRAGELLNKLLEQVGLLRSETMIINAVRCQLDKEKKEAKLAMKHCREYAVKAIEHCKPDLIICLGEYAMKQILGNKYKLSTTRGTVVESAEFGCKVFVTFHPAFILRGASSKYPNIPYELMSSKEKSLFSDFKFVRSLMVNGYKEPEIDTSGYRKIRGPLELLPELKAKVVAVDFETNTNDLKRPKARVLSVSFTTKPGRSKVVTIGDTVPKIVQDILSSGSTKIVASRPFDEEATKLIGTKMGGRVVNILSMAHVLDENFTGSSYNLQAVANTHTDLRNIKDLAEGMRSQLEEANEDLLVRYNGVDSDATLRAYRAMTDKLNRDPKLKRYYGHFIQPIEDMLSDIWGTGCLVDVDRLRRNEQEVLRIKNEAETEALSYLPISIAEEHREKGITLSRPALLLDYLFMHKDGLNLKPIMLTPKTKIPTTGIEHLKYFMDVPFVRANSRYRKADKIETYISRLWGFLHPDSRIYPSTLLTRTVTGRSVIIRPEMQTYPKRGEFAPLIRSAIIPDPGFLLCGRDLSQSELRIAGWLAAEDNILNALRSNIDLHRKTAATVNKVLISEVTKDMRQKAKAVNFGFIYGQSAEGFRNYARDEYDLDFTLEECVDIREAFFSKPDGYWKLLLWHEHMRNMARRNGYVESPLGRRRRLPAIHSDSGVDRSEAERQAINSPVQSFSSDLGFLGMYLAWKEIKSNPYWRERIKLLWFIHDEIVFQAREDCVQEAHLLMKECMEERTVEYIRKKFDVAIGYPIQSDGKVGPRWSEMEEI